MSPAPWNQDDRPGKQRLHPKDTRQHSPCRSCYSDCISDDQTALLQFHCPNCGKEHTTSRGESLDHTRFLGRFYAGHDARNQ